MTKFQLGIILTCYRLDGQTHTIKKAIRPLFADLVTNQHCNEHRISLYHELPTILEIFYSQHVYCYGNNAKYWVLFISCVTKWLIFQNLDLFALNEK